MIYFCLSLLIMMDVCVIKGMEKTDTVDKAQQLDTPKIETVNTGPGILSTILSLAKEDNPSMNLLQTIFSKFPDREKKQFILRQLNDSKELQQRLDGIQCSQSITEYLEECSKQTKAFYREKELKDPELLLMQEELSGFRERVQDADVSLKHTRKEQETAESKFSEEEKLLAQEREQAERLLAQIQQKQKEFDETRKRSLQGFEAKIADDSLRKQRLILEKINAAYTLAVGCFEKKDYEHARQNFEYVAGQDVDKQLKANAEYHLGLIYKYGLGVTKDLKEAVNLLNSAADKLNSDALYILGSSLYLEEGKPHEAFRILNLSAAQNNIAAKHFLDACFYREAALPLLIDERYVINELRFALDEDAAANFLDTCDKDNWISALHGFLQGGTDFDTTGKYYKKVRLLSAKIANELNVLMQRLKHLKITSPTRCKTMVTRAIELTKMLNNFPQGNASIIAEEEYIRSLATE